MKILHTADWHLQDKDVEEIEKNANFMLDYAQAEKVDLIIHAGDATNSENLKLDSLSTKALIRLFYRMANIAPVVFCLGTNSHDGTSPESFSFIKGKFPIHVALRTEQVFLFENEFHDIHDQEIDKPDALISFCPPPSKQWLNSAGSIEESDKEVQLLLAGIFAGFGNVANQYECPHIFAGHFNVSGSFISETQQLIGRDIEVSKEQLNMLNADVVCLGHIHKQQQIGDNIFYSGDLHRKTFGELDEKGFYIHNIKHFDKTFEIEVIRSSEFIKVPAINKFINKHDFTNTLDSLIGLIDYMEIITEPCDLAHHNAKYLIRIKIWQDEVKQINRKEIKQYFLDEGAIDCQIELDVIPREITRNKEVHEAKTLPDKLKVLAVSRDEKIEPGVLERAEDLERGLSSKELIEKYEIS